MSERFVRHGGAQLHYRVEGADGGRPLVLLNSIGTDIGLWDEAADRLRERFQIVRIDTRGHGASSVTDGDYDMAMLAGDLAAVLDHAGIARPVVAGVSLGGMIAMQFAADRPGRICGLLPICTSVTMDSDAWADRVALVRSGGMEAIADLAMPRFLSASFRAERPDAANRLRERLLSMDRSGYAGCASAIRDMSLRERLGEIACPTLVVTGDSDISTPFAGHGEHLVKGISAATHRSLPCGHLAPVECPEALAAIVADFATNMR